RKSRGAAAWLRPPTRRTAPRPTRANGSQPRGLGAAKNEIRTTHATCRHPRKSAVFGAEVRFYLADVSARGMGLLVTECAKNACCTTPAAATADEHPTAIALTIAGIARITSAAPARP